MSTQYNRYIILHRYIVENSCMIGNAYYTGKSTISSFTSSKIVFTAMNIGSGAL